jgi:hypothetical protein
MHGSRAESFGSIDALAQGSTLVAVGEVTKSEAAADLGTETQFTIHTFAVKDVWDVPNLGRALGVSGAKVSAGSEVIVRQVGTVRLSPSPILEMGRTYLLYLTPSQLEGEKASHFYVTGADAGIYVSPVGQEVNATQDLTFEQAAPNEVDRLPRTIDRETVAG